MNIPHELKRLLEARVVTDILINSPSEVFYDEGSGLERSTADFFSDESTYKTFVLEQISISGKTWDAKLPFLDTTWFGTHRAHIAFPPLAQHGICVSLRRLPRATGISIQEAKLQAFNRWNNSKSAFELLVQAVEAHETLIFAGATGSGKTTLLNDLLGFVHPQERLITLEDTPEILPHHPHVLSLLSRTANADGYGAVSLRDLLRQTLRMRPDRILLGECRSDEVLDLLLALNTGHRGTFGTLHANSAQDALKRIELLALLASRGTVPPSLIRELIAKGIQKIVFLDRENHQRKIKTILNLEGKERDIIFTRVIYDSQHSLQTDRRKTPALSSQY